MQLDTLFSLPFNLEYLAYSCLMACPLFIFSYQFGFFDTYSTGGYLLTTYNLVGFREIKDEI